MVLIADLFDISCRKIQGSDWQQKGTAHEERPHHLWLKAFLDPEGPGNLKIGYLKST